MPIVAARKVLRCIRAGIMSYLAWLPSGGDCTAHDRWCRRCILHQDLSRIRGEKEIRDFQEVSALPLLHGYAAFPDKQQAFARHRQVSLKLLCRF